MPTFKRPAHHLMVCASFRTSGEPKGVCHRKEATNLLAYLETEISDRGLDAQVSSTGCLKLCDEGPVLVVYPENWWYGKVDEERLDTILDALEEGEAVEDMLIA